MTRRNWPRFDRAGQASDRRSVEIRRKIDQAGEAGAVARLQRGVAGDNQPADFRRVPGVEPFQQKADREGSQGRSQ